MGQSSDVFHIPYGLINTGAIYIFHRTNLLSDVLDIATEYIIWLSHSIISIVL